MDIDELFGYLRLVYPQCKLEFEFYPDTEIFKIVLTAYIEEREDYHHTPVPRLIEQTISKVFTTSLLNEENSAYRISIALIRKLWFKSPTLLDLPNEMKKEIVKENFDEFFFGSRI